MNAAEKRVAMRWIPKGSMAVRIKNADAVVYVSESSGPSKYKFIGIAYSGTAQKRDWYYSYPTAEMLARKIKEYGEALKQRSEYCATQKAKRKAFVHSLQLGDVLRCSWGYEQTNIDYYEVTKVIGKYVEAREIGKDRKETAWCVGKCVPSPGHYVGEAKRYLVGEGNSLKIASYARAYPAEHKVICGAKVYEVSNWTAYA